MPAAPSWGTLRWCSVFLCLSFFALLIHGYHPFADDGGLYIAGVQYKLDPTLFPHYTAFVTEHLGFSIFATAVAAVVRTLHLPLDWALLWIEFFSLVLTFFAAHQLLRRCIPSEAAQLGGLALLAAWWTLPIAGTSLLLMDPYLTARSVSTPLTLLAIAFALDDWRRPHQPALTLTRRHRNSAYACLGCLLIAAALHPLMAAYAASFVLTLRLARLPARRAALVALAGVAVVFSAAINTFSTTDSQTAVAAELTRYYWFLSQWQWFELLGLAGPIAILALLLRSARHATEAARMLLRTTMYLGSLAVLIALLFCHQNSRTHFVAHLQPLRIFLPVYAIMTLLLGATLTGALQRRRDRSTATGARSMLAALPVVCFAVLSTIFFVVQRNTFPASPHLELPGREASNNNPWVQAFQWARANTPRDALFALDAKYINQEGEDAQTFRAWSLRSALPDYSKDGGEAAITPSLAGIWLPAAEAQRNLSAERDATRDAQLRPLGATWMIVRAAAATQHPCPYRNAAVKVCRLR